MAGVSEPNDPTEGRHRQFYQALSREERILITLRDELYSGSWGSMLDDLKARLGGKPYIFRLATRIEEDIARIEKLRGYERDNGIDLGTLAQKEE